MATLHAHVVALPTLEAFWQQLEIDLSMELDGPLTDAFLQLHSATLLLQQFHDDEGEIVHYPSPTLDSYLLELVDEIVQRCTDHHWDPFDIICLYPIPGRQSQLVIVIEEQ